MHCEREQQIPHPAKTAGIRDDTTTSGFVDGMSAEPIRRREEDPTCNRHVGTGGGEERSLSKTLEFEVRSERVPHFGAQGRLYGAEDCPARVLSPNGLG
jgi:hypothetical protein